MKIGRFLFFIVLASLAGLALAHMPTKPVSPNFELTGMYGSSHANFGYIGDSEAQSATSLDFLCRPQDRARYATEACGLTGSTPSNERVTELLQGLEQGMFKRDLQQNVAQYLLMQRRAYGNNAIPMTVARPQCVAADSDAEWMRTAMPVNIEESVSNYETAVMDETMDVSALSPDERRNLKYGQRIRTMENGKFERNVFEALAYYDSLKIDYSERNCDRHSNRTKMQCMALEVHLHKLRMSYPVLFDMPSETADERTRLNDMREKVYALLGTSGASPTFNERRLGNRYVSLVDAGTIDPEAVNDEEQSMTVLLEGETKAQRTQRLEDARQRINRGRQIYRTHAREMSNGDSNALRDLNSKIHTALTNEGCSRGELDPFEMFGSTEEQPAAMPEADFQRLRAPCLKRKAIMTPVLRAAVGAVNDRADEIRLYNGGKLAQMCNLSTAQLTEQYPQVLRQMISDASGSTLAAYRGAMCNSGLLDRFPPNPMNTCVGVTGDPDDTKGMRVRRNVYDFPFGQDNDYKIKRAADGTMEIETTVNFARGSGVTTAQFNERIRESLANAQSFFNTQAGLQTPALNPAVRFTVLSGRGTSQPLVTIRKCWHSTRKRNRSACDGSGNQADSANWPLDSDEGTVRHEVGHLFGLNDEYESEYYPFNNLGEHDSIMNASNSSSRLYPRHFASILAPVVRCEVGAP